MSGTGNHNNSSVNDTNEYVGEPIPDYFRILFIVVGIFYVIVGVAGNLVIIVTIATNKSMRNPHYCFIANLALADIIITDAILMMYSFQGYVLPWLVMSLILRHYPVVDFDHCVFNGFLTVCAYVASLISLLAISINRCLNICYNALFDRIFSRKILSSLIGCGLIWLVSIMCTLPCLSGWGRFVFDRKVHYCGYDRTYSYSYTLFLLLFSIGIPVVLVFVCNFCIWRYVRRSSHRIYAATRGDRGRRFRDVRVVRGHAGVHDSGHLRVQGQVPVQDRHNDGVGHGRRGYRGSCSSHDVASTSAFEPSASAAAVTADVEDRTSPLVTPDELALIKTVFAVFITFAVCMSPYMISTLVDTEDKWSPVLHLSCSYTSFTNSVLNCLLYGLMTPKFKAAFRSLFSWMVRKRHVVAVESSVREKRAQQLSQDTTA